MRPKGHWPLWHYIFGKMEPFLYHNYNVFDSDKNKIEKYSGKLLNLRNESIFFEYDEEIYNNLSNHERHNDT